MLGAGGTPARRFAECAFRSSMDAGPPGCGINPTRLAAPAPNPLHKQLIEAKIAG
jgi:hypothetical protein